MNSTSHADDPDLIGAVLGDRYRVDALLGRGGMGTVYRASDESLGRDVALKILRSSPDDAAAVRRERAEVTLLASLNHRSLVTLFDAAEYEVGGHPRTCLVMEFVDGPTLSQVISSRTIAGAEITTMLTDLAEALSVVHAKGVVHRDIKPANILLGASHLPGQQFAARLADFGIAYLVDSTRLTEAGTLIGTAAYLSPEQATGAEPSAAADIYSLGLVVLETLTGRREFDGTMVESVSARLARDPAVPSWLDEGWRTLLARMTVRDPAARPTAVEVVALARELGAPGSDELAPTVEQSIEATRELLAPTAVMPAPTAVMPTTVMPTSGDAAVTRPTERLAPLTEASPATAVSRRAAPSRKVLAVLGAAVVLVIVAVLVALGSRQAATPETAPTLPAVDGDLGTHLQQLFDEAGR